MIVSTTNELIANSHPPAPTNVATAPTRSPIGDSEKSNALNYSNDRTTITTLAGQLSEAALRAKDRYGSSSKQQLRKMNSDSFELLGGITYKNNKIKHDTETPNTKDPELLERAKKATNYVNDLGRNPFSGMKRDQLELIIFDDSGHFTINEKRAALYENYNQEQEWRKTVLAEYDLEKNRSGKGSIFYQQVLDHYRSLPLVAQSEYPDGYEAKLQEWIDEDLNMATSPPTPEGKKPNKNLSPEIAQKILAQDSSLFKIMPAPEQTGAEPTLDHPGATSEA